MADIVRNEELSLDDSVKTNKQGKPILGTLTGPCADFVSATRNGRKYDESLWEKVFADPIVKEYFECGGIPGELDHPAEREETCSEKIAIMMPEPPKKDNNGHLIATFDILDTPNGRIAFTLAKYGYKLGISSRGSGDTYFDEDGSEHVDEDSYNFQAFDLVLLPAVKAARLNFEPMSESLKANQDSFKQAIRESLKKSSADEKRIMVETLKSLGIKYSPEKVNINSNSSNDNVADNSGTAIVKELQESLKKQLSLEQQITKLQEKLSVCYAKESEYEELKVSHKNTQKKLADSVKVIESLKTRVSELIKSGRDSKEEKDKLVSSVKTLEESLDKGEDKTQRLRESLSEKSREIKSLNESISRLESDLDESESRANSLEESIEELKKDSALKDSEYSSKLAKANTIVEKYKKVAKRAVDKYIDLQASCIGVGRNEIVNKLSENYSFEDIDKACQELRDYQINISKLPFAASRVKSAKMQIKESKDPILSAAGIRVDDSVDDSLYYLAGLK